MKNFREISVFVIVLIILSCATDYKRPPAGGPDDRTRPTVKFASIQDNSLNIGRNERIRIDFSKYIDRNSSRNAISISPRSAAKKSKVLWYDKSVTIDFKNLDANRTVVITINPSLKDQRGNSLETSYSLSFSTGNEIERKNISGIINGGINKNEIVFLNYSGIKVNLYDVSLEDSVNYERIEPEYSTGVSQNFQFELKNLSSGTYKLLVFNDLNNDSRPQFESEMIGFTSSLCDLKEKDSLYFYLTMGLNDTYPPFIKNTTQIRNDIIKIEFSEDIKEVKNVIDSVHINRETVDFEDIFSRSDRKTAYLKTRQLNIGDVVRVKLSDIEDDFGNMIRPDFKIRTHTVSDTVPKQDFRIAGRLPDRIAPDGKLEILTNSFENDSLNLRLISKKDSTVTILSEGVITEPFRYAIELNKNNINPDNYELMVSFGDSTIQKSSIIIEEETGYGIVSGKISDSACDTTTLIFRSVHKGESRREQIRGQEYNIQLRPGKYLCAAFEDCDGKKVFGTDINNNSIQKAVFYGDTVLVRKNWESSNVDFGFKK